MTLGEKLTQARRTAGLTQADVATKLNVSRQAVSRWESGQSKPSTEKLLALGALYGVSTDQLLNAENVEVPAVETVSAPPEVEPREPVIPEKRRTRVWLKYAAAVLCGVIVTLFIVCLFSKSRSIGKKRPKSIEGLKTEDISSKPESYFDFTWDGLLHKNGTDYKRHERHRVPCSTEVPMKKEFCIVIAALLVLSLTACGKSKSTNSVPLVDCSDRGSAVEGGCYLMTEETPDEICEEAKVIFSENLSQWVSVFEGDAGEYVLGTPYHTHLRPDNTDVYSFPVLCNGEFWRILSIYKPDGEILHQFSPTAEKFQRLHSLSSPENPIRFVWVGDVRYAVVGNTAEIITHEGGDIPDNIGELAVQSDLPDSVIIDISKPIAIAEIAAENESN